MSLDASKLRMGTRWRAVLIGLLLIPLNSFWIMQMEAVYYSAHSTVYGLFFNTICNLLVLIGLNVPLKKFSPGLAFSQGELLTVYIMLNLSSALVGHSTMQLLPPTMAAPFGLATPENEWGELFGRYIPRWLAISDERALDGYITGLKSESTLYTARYIEAWLGPVLIWSLFICVLMFVMFCINIILRKQWTDRERLTFPIAQLPYEMTDPVSGVFKYKLFWVSFIIVGGVNIINGFHFFFPEIPYLRVRPYNLGAFFTTKPWDALGYAPVTFRPFLIGLIFLIPLDMIFSCWFFFFFWKAQLILGSALGLRQRPEFPEQSAGAYIALCVIALWMGKGHLARIVKSVFHLAAGENRDDGDTEPLQYRTAVLGLICGFAFILVFCWKAGMSLWAAGVFFALYLMTEVGVTRVRAEVGSPIHDLHFAGPEYLMVDAVGTRNLGPGNLSILSFFWFLTRAHYSDVMPHQLEGFKLADRAQAGPRGILVAMLIATVFGTIVAFWAILDSAYRHSGVVMSWAGIEPFRRLGGWLSYPTSTDMMGMGFFAYGLLFGIFLMAMRLQFIWWPFHPAGYAVSSTYGMRDYWSMFLLVWLVKGLILRHGGLKVHRQAMPLFLGMILGEFAIGGFWALFGVVFKTQTYNFTAWW
ncbi:hypothetical protein HYR99_30460 [Candidatus Poribacteria bacterium]|nr:hypothetical protein [Candidatus Poribacteria bacterium]